MRRFEATAIMRLINCIIIIIIIIIILCLFNWRIHKCTCPSLFNHVQPCMQHKAMKVVSKAGKYILKVCYNCSYKHWNTQIQHPIQHLEQPRLTSLADSQCPRAPQDTRKWLSTVKDLADRVWELFTSFSYWSIVRFICHGDYM